MVLNGTEHDFSQTGWLCSRRCYEAIGHMPLREVMITDEAA
jgi:hypothetical protein